MSSSIPAPRSAVARSARDKSLRAGGQLFAAAANSGGTSLSPLSMTGTISSTVRARSSTSSLWSEWSKIDIGVTSLLGSGKAGKRPFLQSRCPDSAREEEATLPGRALSCRACQPRPFSMPPAPPAASRATACAPIQRPWRSWAPVTDKRPRTEEVSLLDSFVFGSAGSIVGVFRHQLKNGLPFVFGNARCPGCSRRAISQLSVLKIERTHGCRATDG